MKTGLLASSENHAQMSDISLAILDLEQIQKRILLAYPSP